MFLFCFHSWKHFFFSLCSSYFISTLCNYFPLSFGFHCYCWEIGCKSNCFSLQVICPFLFVCFWISEVQLWCVCGWVFFYLSYMEFTGLLEYVNWCFSHDICNILFHFLFKYFLCQPLSPLLLDCWLNLLQTYFFIFRFWQSLPLKKIILSFWAIFL